MEHKTLAERIHLLTLQLRQRGVDARLVEQVSITLANPDNLDNLVDLAAMLRRGGNFDAAASVYQLALQVFGNSALLWNNYGILLQHWEKLSEALSAFDRAIELDASYATALANKGRVLELLQRFPEARSCYEAALEIDPHHPYYPDIANNIGACLVGEGEARQAEIWFEKSLQVDPKFGNALFNLAKQRLQHGDRDSARHYLDRLSPLLPDDPEVKALQAWLQGEDSTPSNVEPRPAGNLDIDGIRPTVLQLVSELAENPRSIFISYAWANASTKRFAARLCRELESRSFQVVLDENYKLEVEEILALLLACKNAIVLNDQDYAESCLLGKVPITKPTSPYPSFAFPPTGMNQEYLWEVMKISAVAWDIAKSIEDKGDWQVAAHLAIEFAQPEEWAKVPGLRLFMEGYRVDEAQLLFLNRRRFRSISIAYLGGEHCLAGHPILDFSKDEYFPASLAALLKALELGQRLPAKDAPIDFNNPDLSNCFWSDSDIISANLWTFTDEDVVVLRPSITPSGQAAPFFSPFKEWKLAQ